MLGLYRLNKNKRIILTLGISLLCHLLLLMKLGLPLSEYKGQRNNVVTVELAPSENMTELLAQNTLPTLKAQSDVPAALSAINESESKSKSAIEPNKNPEVTNEKKVVVPITNDHQEPINTDVNQAVDSRQSSVSIEKLTPYKNVELEFEIFSTKDGKTLSKAQQHFLASDPDNYQLDTRKVSIADESLENWQIDVSGKIFRNRLSPSQFQLYGSTADEIFRISRYTQTGIQIKEKPKSGRMPDGILDRQSLTYYFMFSPPSSIDSDILLSDGAKINTYKIHLSNIVFLETSEFGRVEVVVITLSNIDNSEKIELWLAPVFKYLPLRIDYTDDTGNVIEQRIYKLHAE